MDPAPCSRLYCHGSPPLAQKVGPGILGGSGAPVPALYGQTGGLRPLILASGRQHSGESLQDNGSLPQYEESSPLSQHSPLGLQPDGTAPLGQVVSSFLSGTTNSTQPSLDSDDACSLMDVLIALPNHSGPRLQEYRGLLQKQEFSSLSYHFPLGLNQDNAGPHV